MHNGYFIQSGISGNDINQIKNFLGKVKPSSIILNKNNFHGLVELKNIIHEINHFYKIDLNIDIPYFAIDQEGGNVVRIMDIDYIPSNYALGRINNLNLTRYAAMVTGFKLNSYGIKWNLAPDLDILKNTENKVILERSFSKDVITVAAHGAAYINGINKSGVAATAKHFPGHGYVEADSHEILPSDDRSYPEIENDMYPFTVAIAHNVNAIMMSHVLFPEIDDYPASLSSKFYSILRKDLKFGGVIITDSVNMNAISKNYSIKEIVHNTISNADFIECVDTDMVMEILECMNHTVINNADQKAMRIKNLIINKKLGYKPPEHLMSIISFLSVEWKRVKILDPEKETLLIFMPYNLTRVNSSINNNNRLISELKKYKMKYNIIDFDGFQKFTEKNKQIIFIGRNEVFHNNYKIINEKSLNNDCVYVSTGIDNDTGLLNDDIGYISTYSTKIDNIINAIYKIFGFS